MAKKVYAVAVGRCPGIYNSWDDCKKQTHGFKAAKFKSFPTKQEAQAFVQEYSIKQKQEQPAVAQEEPPAKRRKHAAKITITIHFDGGSRGNPGLGGAGAQVVVSETILPTTSSSNNDRIVHLTKFLGTRGVTNNEAEYHGMLVALEEAHKQVQAFSKDHSSSCEACIKIHGDSNLIIQQMQGKYQVKSEKLMPLHRQAKQQIASMKKLMDTQIDFAHVYRADNTIADVLANNAMDSRTSSNTLISSSSSQTDDPTIIPGGVDV